MPWFIKTERFKETTLNLSPNHRKAFIAKHREWALKLSESGVKISSGYLVDSTHAPGGGGLLIIEAFSYEEARSIVEKDPMIISDLVTWTLQEWIPVYGHLNLT